MTPTVIMIAAFVGVAALVGAVAFLMRGQSGQEVEDRLDILSGAKKKKNAGLDEEQQSVLSHPLDDRPGFLEVLASRFLNIRRLLEQADAPIAPSKFVLLIGLLAGGGLGVCIFLRLPAWVGPVVAVSLGVMPLLWLVLKRKKRLARFAKQLPDALEMMSRALRAGHSLAAGFQLVASEMMSPIAEEFERVYEQQNLGISLEDALDEMTERVPNVDLRFFATAVILQRQTGGDLAEILDKIGRLIRERFQIWGQIQALTGEGRLSGVVLLALPPVLFLVMYKLNPSYTMMLFEDPMGKKMLVFALVMQFLGAYVIRKIVNIKV